MKRFIFIVGWNEVSTQMAKSSWDGSSGAICLGFRSVFWLVCHGCWSWISQCGFFMCMFSAWACLVSLSPSIWLAGASSQHGGLQRDFMALASPSLCCKTGRSCQFLKAST